MEKFMTSIYNLITKWDDALYLLMAVSLIIYGVMFIIPSQEIKDKAKKGIPFVLIGAGLVVGATFIAKEISEAFVF